MTKTKTKSKMVPHVGDKVKTSHSFEGIYSGTRWKRSRKTAPYQVAIVVSLPGVEPECYVETPLETIRVTGPAAMHARKARMALAGIKRKIADSKTKRRSARYDEVLERGINDLRMNEQIQVVYRDEIWRTVTFRGIVHSSGKVRFCELGSSRVRYTHPKFVRVLSRLEGEALEDAAIEILLKGNG